MVRDKVVVAAFHKECIAHSSRWCLSTEHYASTLLAHRGLANETHCTPITHDVWDRPGAPHPKTYLLHEVGGRAVEGRRAWAGSTGALADCVCCAALRARLDS